MPLDLDEKYKVHKVANKIVNMIESSGGDIFQPEKTFTHVDSDMECLQLYYWYYVELFYPESHLNINIEIFYDCKCDAKFECNCESWIDLLAHQHTVGKSIKQQITDPETFDYSSFVNGVVDLMNSKK